MSMPPLKLPELPSYSRLPDYLEAEVAAAFQQQLAVTNALAAIRTPDPGFRDFLREAGLEIALAVAKTASSCAVCQVQDWLDEVDP